MNFTTNYSVKSFMIEPTRRFILNLNPSNSFSFFVVKNNVIYGLRNGDSGYSASDWVKLPL